jgi:hypothetical protein
MCYWCNKAPSTEADHIVPFDAGGSDDESNLVGACKPCNSKRGTQYVNQKRAIQQQRRNEALGIHKSEKTRRFFVTETTPPPTPSYRLSQERARPGEFTQIGEDLGEFGRDAARLVTPVCGYESFGGLIAEWSRVHLGRELFPWQQFALGGAFQVDDGNKFVHSKALISAARQNGKTSMNAAIVGWCLSELPRIWGRPVRIMSSAHELSLAAEVFEELRDVFELWEESDLCKVTWAYGRQRVQMVDGSIYAVRAATSKKHGGTWDILLLDEVWAMTEGSIFGALLPSQIAVASPMCWMTSTAGDESSRAFIKLREQGLAAIDSGQATDLFMAEWSMPGGLDPDDPKNFGWANPSLGRTITVKGLQNAAAAPDRSQFLRAHCNLWVAAASSWLPPGLWASCQTENVEPDGGHSVLAVDSAVDESKYLGVWCRLNSEKNIVATIKFSTESLVQMWDKIGEALDADPKLKLAITPSLFLHTPEKYRMRTVQWGYAELLKYTSLVLSLIREGRVKHDGSEMLAEHCNRAVLVAAQGAKVVSTQRSPGPIEAARCMITAAAMVSRPGGAAKPSMGAAK